MANYCEFMMKVKGSEDAILSFSGVLAKSLEKLTDGCLGGLVSYADGTIHNGCKFVTGVCKWSVETSFMEGEHSFYKGYSDPVKDFLKEHGLTPVKLTSLPKLAEELDLTIEVFGEEPGLAFMEYYLITPKGVEENICIGKCFQTKKGVVTYGVFTI